MADNESVSLKLVKSDHLEVEYMKIATTDLSTPFIWRIVVPVNLPWQTGRFTLCGTLQSGMSFDKMVEKLAMDYWHNIHKDHEPFAELEWLWQIKEAKVYEVTTIRK